MVTGEVADSESKRNKVKTEAVATLKMKEGVMSQRTPCPSRDEERQKPDRSGVARRTTALQTPS